MHTASVPPIVGDAVTVTVAVVLHPALLVYVITLVPAATPVTSPELLTVATVGVAETHGVDVAAVPEPVSSVEAPMQVVSVPEMVGDALMVTVAVLVHPALVV